jgi:hypothetical protein
MGTSSVAATPALTSRKYLIRPDILQRTAFRPQGMIPSRTRSYFFAGSTTSVSGRDGCDTSVFGRCVAFGSLLYGTWA